MNDPRDDRSSDSRSAAVPPDAAQPRKPRIEVLQRGPAGAPTAAPAQNPHGSGIDAAGIAAPAGSPAQAARAEPNLPRHAEAPPERRRTGLFRSRTTLLMLLAAIVTAGFLLYTYLSSERDAEYPDKGTELSPADAELIGSPDPSTGAAATQALDEPAETTSIEEAAAEPEPAESTAPERTIAPTDAPDARPAAVADRPDGPQDARTVRPDNDPGVSDTVRAFYSALSAGDGASAAQLVVPSKRRSGPLSAGALSRYYSSLRRPLRLQSVTAVDANTVRVAYDYVLADGRLCRGQASVGVVQREGRNLVSGIRTRGPC
jgi:hypothetical protein